MILEKGITIEIDGVYIYGNDLEKVKISEAIDPIGAEIPIGTCDFIIKRHPKFESLFDYGKFFKVYFDGKIKTIVRVYSTQIIDATRMEIQSEDLFGVLEDAVYFGNIVYPIVDNTVDNRPKAGDVLRDILDTAKVKYEIDPELEDIKINGQLLKTTCRDALMQVCFAIGAIAFCSGQNYITIKKPDNEVKQIIPKERIKEGTKFTTNIMTKIVSMQVGYRRIWDDNTGETVIFTFNDTSKVKAGEIREYIHEQPVGGYQMKSTSASGNVQNINENSKYFKFLEQKPNKVVVQFLEIYKNYSVDSNKYFNFNLNDETMTAEVSLSSDASELTSILFPYTYNIGDKWYEIISIGDCTSWDYPGGVRISPTVKTIKSNAFKNSRILNIRIPYSVDTIGKDAFLGTDMATVYYEGSPSSWSQINFEEGNESLKNNDNIVFNYEYYEKRPFGLVGYNYEETWSNNEVKINPSAINYPYSQEAKIDHATLVTYDYGEEGNSSVKSGNLSEVLDRVFKELTKTEQIECVIFEGRNVQEGDFVRYGQDSYGSVVYGSQRKAEITYDKPVKLGDIIGIEANEYGYREKRIISQEYELNGNIIAKRCILK